MDTYPINITGSGDKVVLIGQADKRITVYNYTVLSDIDSVLIFKSGTRSMSGAMPILASGGWAPSGAHNLPVLQCSVGEDFIINVSNAADIDGHYMAAYV